MTVRLLLIALLVAGVAVAFVYTQVATYDTVDGNAPASTRTENGGPEDAAYWIEVMRQGTSEAREAGREALIAMGTEAVPALIEATRDETGFIRWEAVNAVGIIAHDDSQSVLVAIPALVHVAFTDENPHPRWRSLWALLRFPDDVAAQQIVPLLRTGLEDPNDPLRWHAAVALANFRRFEVAPLLNEGTTRTDSFERWEAVWCLSVVHDENSVTALAQVVLDVEGTRTNVRQEAALTLGKIGDPAALPALACALGDDPEPGVRSRAAQALEKIEAAAALPELLAAVEREQDSFAREQIEAIIARLQQWADE
jgi:HEAT repeat protein